MKKFFVCILLLALVLSIAPAVLAQEDTLGLSQSDYDLWSSANKTSFDFNTVSFSFTASLSTAGMGADRTVDLTGNGAADRTDPSNVSLQADLTGNATSGADTTPITINLRLVDGTMYANDGSGWVGGDPQELMTGFMLGLMGASGADLSSLGGSGVTSQLMDMISSLTPPDYIGSITRADTNGVADFTVNVDMVKLLNSNAMATVFASMMASGGGFGMAGGAAATQQSNSLQSQMMDLFGAIFSSDITVDELVDPSTQLISEVKVNVVPGADAGSSTLTGDLDLTLSDYNQPVTVEVPSDVQMMTPEATPAS